MTDSTCVVAPAPSGSQERRRELEGARRDRVRRDVTNGLRNSRLRDELFAREIFTSVREATVLYDDWRHLYNHHRPHSALGYLPPAVFAAALNKPELS